MMITPPPSRNNRKVVLQWLEEVIQSKELNYPIHRMNVDGWYQLFNSHHENHVLDNDPIFSDKRYFALQMTNICDNPGFPGLSKEQLTYPVYETYYSYTYDDSLSTLCNGILHSNGKYLYQITIYYIFNTL